MRKPLALAAACVALALPLAAHAETPFEPRAEGTRIGLSADVWPAADFTLVVMGVGAQVGIGKHFAVDVDVPWALGAGSGFSSVLSLNGADQTRAIFGDVTLGGHATGKVTADVSLNGGLSVSIPTRSQAFASSFAITTLALGHHAFFDLQRFLPGYVGLRMPLGAEARFGRVFYYRGELTPGLYLPTSSGSQGGLVVLEHADELEARAPFGFGGGLRFQAAFFLNDPASEASTGRTGDRAQTALEPFVGYEPSGSGFYARLGLLCALDGPAGFGFDKDKLAAVRMQVGGKL